MLDKRTVREIAVKYVEEVRKFLNPSSFVKHIIKTDEVIYKAA
jgi:hypothetical protein